MQLDEAKDKFIQAWGSLGSNWGINRTMAQVHALLLITPESLSADEIMGALNISRGNANMNIRALIDWGLVQKELKSGERKEFFVAEKDIWEVARRVMLERKKLLVETDSQKTRSGLLRIYEHRYSGEVFIVKDPQIPLSEVAAIQEEVQLLLSPPEEESAVAGSVQDEPSTDRSPEEA